MGALKTENDPFTEVFIVGHSLSTDGVSMEPMFDMYSDETQEKCLSAGRRVGGYHLDSVVKLLKYLVFDLKIKKITFIVCEIAVNEESLGHAGSFQQDDYIFNFYPATKKLFDNTDTSNQLRMSDAPVWGIGESRLEIDDLSILEYFAYKLCSSYEQMTVKPKISTTELIGLNGIGFIDSEPNSSKELTTNFSSKLQGKWFKMTDDIENGKKNAKNKKKHAGSWARDKKFNARDAFFSKAVEEHVPQTVSIMLNFYNLMYL